MTDPAYRDLKLLGTHAPLPASPEEAVLERVPNPHPGETYLVRFTAPEFTSLCPVTGQPDFAHLVIDYVPDAASRREQIAEALPRRVPQSRRVPRGLHARYRQARSSRRSRRNGCVSAAIGIRAAACRSTSSIRPARRPKGCGCPIPAFNPIADGVSGLIPTFARRCCKCFANVGMGRPLPTIKFSWSFRFDIRLEASSDTGGECQIRSTIDERGRQSGDPQSGARSGLRRDRLRTAGACRRSAAASRANFSPAAITAIWAGSRPAPTSACSRRTFGPRSRPSSSSASITAPKATRLPAWPIRSKATSRSMPAAATITT